MRVRRGSLGTRLRTAPPVLLFGATALALPLLGLAIMIASDSVPDRLVMDHLVESIDSGALDETDHSIGYRGGVVDHFSECKRMTVGLGDPPGVGTVESAIRSPTLGRCSSTVPAVRAWSDGEGLLRQFDYIRYWNGSAAVLRPGIAITGLSGTRLMLAGCLVGFGALAWRSAAVRLGRPATVLGAFVLAASTDFIDLPGALVHAVAWCCILLTAAVTLHLGVTETRGVVAWVAFTLGAVFLFLGDMANPEAAWTVATGAAGLGVLHTGRPRLVFERMAISAAAWITGFAWMWMSKWIIAALVVGTDSIRTNVSGAVETRLDGSIDDGTSPTAGDAVGRVWDAWWSLPLTPAIIVTACGAGSLMVARRGRVAFGQHWRPRLLVGLVPAIPLMWYVVLRNHTYIHNSFVYRSLAVSVAISLMAWTAQIPEPTTADVPPTAT